MDRREFLTSTGVAAAASAALARPAASSAAPTTPHVLSRPRHIRIALPRSIETLSTGMAARRLAHRLQGGLGDEFRVEVVPVSGLALDAMRAGEADAYYVLEADLAVLHPAFALFAGMPRGEDIDANSTQAWLSVAGGAELWNELSAAFGLRAFAAGHTGRSAGLYADKPIEDAAELKSMRVACRGLARDVVAMLGGTVVDIEESALTGAIYALGLDAAEPLGAVPPAVAQWRYEPGLMGGGMMFSLGFAADTFAALSRQEQMIVEAVTAEAFAHSHAISLIEQQSLRHVAAMRRWPVSTGLPARLDAVLVATSGAVVDKVASTDPLANRIVASHRQFRAALSGDDRSIA